MSEGVQTQIALFHPADVMPCAEAGVDMIAFVADPQQLTPSSLSVAQAKTVSAEIPQGHRSTAIVLSSAVDEIRHIADTLCPDFMQLAAGVNRLPVPEVTKLKMIRQHTKIIMAIGVNDDDPIDSVRRYESVVDSVILDTNDPQRIDVGATGETHDWNISAEIVSRTNVPVMLAGGLSAENVSLAVQSVRPWAVDSFSLTNCHDDPLRKDVTKVSRFVTHAKGA